MTYAVKEIFLTLQGEGCRRGRRAVFLRFAGCNLWTGREQDRAPRNAPSATPTSWAWMAAMRGRYDTGALAHQVAACGARGPARWW
jgi:organic radical activating enzyme